MGQGLGFQLRSGRRIGDDKLLVVESRIAGKINLLAPRRKEYFTLIPHPRRDRRLGKRLSLCIADSYRRITAPVDLSSFSARTREEKHPQAAGSKTAGIASTEMPLEKDRSV